MTFYKFVSIVLCFSLLLPVFAGCKGDKVADNTDSPSTPSPDLSSSLPDDETNSSNTSSQKPSNNKPTRTSVVKKYGLKKGLNLSALEDATKTNSFLDKETTYTDIASKGFDHIRLPVDFRNFSDKNGIIKESFYERLDKIIKMANDSGLVVMLDFHGWYNLNVTNGDDKLFLAIWNDLAKHYKGNNDKLMFELINEPHTTENGDLDMTKLMALQLKALQQIRSIDSERTVVIAAPEWNGPWTLKNFTVPNYDNIIVAIHTYAPLDFTHQGMAWAGTQNVKLPLTTEMLISLTAELILIKEFTDRTGCEVILNEFGLNTTGHISDEDVNKYLTRIVEYTEKNNIPWTYWCYNGDFGVYKSGFLGIGGSWRQNVLDALFPKK